MAAIELDNGLEMLLDARELRGMNQEPSHILVDVGAARPVVERKVWTPPRASPRDAHQEVVTFAMQAMTIVHAR